MNKIVETMPALDPTKTLRDGQMQVELQIYERMHKKARDLLQVLPRSSNATKCGISVREALTRIRDSNRESIKTATYGLCLALMELADVEEAKFFAESPQAMWEDEKRVLLGYGPYRYKIREDPVEAVEEKTLEILDYMLTNADYFRIVLEE